MVKFERGDIVQVCYSSPREIEQWLNGERPVGQDDVGVVKWSTLAPTGSQYMTDVSVTFPMIGTFGMHSCDLVLLQKAEEPCSSAGTS